MAYAIKYQGEFSNTDSVDYRLEIHEKNYVGPFYTLRMGGVPVVHSWNTDEPKPGIKGSSLTIRYINEGAHPVETFYSNADDNFKVIFKKGTDVLFEGFLVQDDFIEPMLDYNHEVTLTANDGLGLLKDIKLDLTAETTTVPCLAQGDAILITAPPQYWINLVNVNFTPAVGSPFTISGHVDAIMNATFTPTQVVVLSATSFRVKVATAITDTALDRCTINGASSIPIPNSRVTLANIVHACLIKTGLELETVIFCNLFEDTHTTDTSFLHQTYVDPEKFISGEEYDNCYSVLEKVFADKLTLFQADGRWVIIRWNEIKFGTVNGFVYDKDFNLTGTENLNSSWLIGFQQDTYPETGLTKQPIRAYEYAQETFNYEQPKYLLKNYDLKKLGTLLRTYVSSGNTIKEYVATDWEDGQFTPYLERFIRVTTDSFGNELARYLVTRGPGNQVAGVMSKPIEVSQGDKIKFSFSFKTSNSQPGNLNYALLVRLTDGSVTRYLNHIPTPLNGQWGTGSGHILNIPSGDNSNQWHTAEMGSQQIPFDGFLYVYLVNASFNTNPLNETHIRDIRFEYQPYINDSTKITGHIHKDKQTQVIKNNKEVEIYIDDSPRNSIAGTLFTGLFNGLLQDKTARWYRAGFTESRRLGDILTSDELQWRSIPRTKLEGNFYGINQVGSISPIRWFTYSELPGLNFVTGSLEVDYRNNSFRATAYEIFNSADVDVLDDYTFTYIYDTK